MLPEGFARPAIAQIEARKTILTTSAWILESGTARLGTGLRTLNDPQGAGAAALRIPLQPDRTDPL